MTLLLAILLLLPAGADEVLIEAEDAELLGVVVDSARSGYSGSGYVTGFDEPGDSLRFHFEVDEGVYEMRLGMFLSGRASQNTFWVDGQPYNRTIFGTGDTFAERYLEELWLTEGSHTLVIKGTFDVDFLRLIPLMRAGPSMPVSELTNSEATPSAQALHRFLLDQYGVQILAGQQDLGDIRYIENVTGRVPAVGAFDLIDYSPSRIDCGVNPGQSAENWIEWAEQDAIVSLAWHWNAPTDLIDENCNPSDNASGQEWWSGFYTRATTFDFAEALADTTSEEYALILRDIDAIAAQLQKFEDEDVPVLWRPLHEAAGGWFWWGAQGPEPFVALWRLLHDRLVHYHGLDNLIWVYTHEPNAFAWYPGDAYADIVSRDVYAGSHEATMESDWGQLQELYGDRKLVALSESGTLPRPEVITAYGIWWSWFAVWSGSFIRDIDQDYLTEVFQSERVMTRDELPDWRSLYTSVEPEQSAVSSDLVLFPNPTHGPATLRATLSAASDVRVDLFDITGRLVRSYAAGYQPAGPLEFDIHVDATVGAYFVRLVAGEYVARRILVVVR